MVKQRVAVSNVCKIRRLPTSISKFERIKADECEHLK